MLRAWAGWFVCGVMVVVMAGQHKAPGRIARAEGESPQAIGGAAAPIITFQGRLTRPSGAPVTTPVQARFRLYTDADPAIAPTAIWTSSLRTITPTQGLFTVYLGDTPDAAILTTTVLANAAAVGVQILPDAEMRPRQDIHSVLGHTAGGSAVVGGASGNGIGVEAYSQLGRALQATTVTGTAVYANASGADAAGVYALSAKGNAVIADSMAPGYAAIFGRNMTSGGIGVYGQSVSLSGRGVYGISTDGVGVYGQSNGVSGRGVYGTSGDGVGVYGRSTNGNAMVAESFAPGYAAIFGRDNAAGSIGVYGESSSATGNGVKGVASGVGVYGQSTTAGGKGVYGVNSNVNSSGVYGEANATGGVGVYGKSAGNVGVYGESGAFSGVYGKTTGATSAGVWGEGTGSSGIGVRGIADGSGGVGVYGTSTVNTGVYGGSANAKGVWGHSNTTQGVYGRTLGTANNSIGVAGEGNGGSSWAGYLFGRSGSSDSNGNAVVELPAYVQAMNGDFGYQLTVIGQFAQVIVAQEIADNRFTIKTDKPNVKVSWQVTGVRKDVVAQHNRLPAEQLKDAGERGKYLHPELYGRPESSGVFYDAQQAGRMPADATMAAPGATVQVAP